MSSWTECLTRVQQLTGGRSHANCSVLLVNIGSCVFTSQHRVAFTKCKPSLVQQHLKTASNSLAAPVSFWTALETRKTHVLIFISLNTKPCTKYGKISQQEVPQKDKNLKNFIKNKFLILLLRQNT